MHHNIGQINHVTAGWVTPLVSFIVAFAGSAVALRNVRWALQLQGGPRISRLAIASFALGSGIWGMHFVGMLGFGVNGMEVRYNVGLTALSLVLAIIVVGAGIFTVGYGQHRDLRLLALGGPATGIGVAGMHYLGMAAMRMDGTVLYSRPVVLVSIVIAVIAATAALWALLHVEGPLAVTGAALVMGLAVCAMHYTGMAAVSVEMAVGALTERSQVEGAAPLSFVMPLVGFFTVFAFVNAFSFAFTPDVIERQAMEQERYERFAH